jgi:squalene-hopene/tetraprenyl-beta-curcumene cyclase
MDGRSEADLAPSLADEDALRRLAPPLRRAICGAQQYLLDGQHAEGYWEGELEGDSILQSEYILLLAFLGREDSEVARQAARKLIEQQSPEGGWSLYPGSPADVSGSVKAYFALKLTGHDPSAEYMQRARSAILAAGGADRVNSFTRFYLALLGQIPYACCPEAPPEVMLLPKWAPINIYRISAWSRTILIPLSIVSAHRPVRELPAELGIRELFLAQPRDWPPLRCPGQQGGTGLFSWDRFFRIADRGLKFLRNRGWLPLRPRAIRRAEAWMLERFEGSDGLGAIFPPIIWCLAALRALGYDDDSPAAVECHRQLEALTIHKGDTAHLQPCKSPVWDTAITLRALAASGTGPDHPSIARATDWLLANEVRRAGDWSATVKAEPGGWCFEHNNEFYPDLDDTAMVLLALRQHVDPSGSNAALPPALNLVSRTAAASVFDGRRAALRIDEIADAARRAIDWMLAMQNRDGGWGAFDKDNDNEFLCHVPFADHNAMIDPSTPDLAARVLEALGHWGMGDEHPAVQRGIEYLRSTQQADGSWFGRWGVNYIYGTWQVLVGLAAVGVADDDPMVTAGVNWLLAHQQPCGGWGESADSYADPSLRGQGPVTASQTAWAVLGLMAADRGEHAAVQRGVQSLVAAQNDTGGWDEPEFTGTGFPQVFYLRYHMYPIYFPLLALGQYAALRGDALTADEPILRMADVGQQEEPVAILSMRG